MIEPIGKEQQAQVIEQSHYFIHAARNIFERDFGEPEILFDLIGGSAGMFKWQQRRCQLRYNPWIFAKYFDDSLENTVPHEVAHYIVHEVFGRRGVQPHGRQWQLLMDAFGVEARVTGNYDLTGIPQRQQRRFLYNCDCREHQISTRRHNLINSGRSNYQCRYCAGELRPVHTDMSSSALNGSSLAVSADARKSGAPPEAMA